MMSFLTTIVSTVVGIGILLGTQNTTICTGTFFWRTPFWGSMLVCRGVIFDVKRGRAGFGSGNTQTPPPEKSDESPLQRGPKVYCSGVNIKECFSMRTSAKAQRTVRRSSRWCEKGTRLGMPLLNHPTGGFLGDHSLSFYVSFPTWLWVKTLYPW